MDDKVKAGLKRLDSIIQIHLMLNLPHTVYIYGYKSEIEAMNDWVSTLGGTSFKWPESDYKPPIESSQICYGGFTFYYMQLPE